MTAKEEPWKESTGDFWKPESKDDEVVGTLVAVEKNVGENNSTLYTIQKDDSNNVNVWGSAVLDSRMKGVRVGEKVRIVYEGLGEKKAGKNPPKLWRVFHYLPEGNSDIPF